MRGFPERFASVVVLRNVCRGSLTTKGNKDSFYSAFRNAAFVIHGIMREWDGADCLTRESWKVSAELQGQ